MLNVLLSRAVHAKTLCKVASLHFLSMEYCWKHVDARVQVPNYGPLLLLERGASTACAAYLYAAPFARTTPLLPVLPAQSDPQPLPPPAWQLPTQQSPPVLPQDSAGVDAGDPNSTAAPSTTNTSKRGPDPSVSHHFKDPVLSPSELGRHKSTLPSNPDPTDPEKVALAQPDVSSDATDAGSTERDSDSTQAQDDATDEEQEPEEDPNEDPPVEGDTTGTSEEASIEDSEETPPGDKTTTVSVDSQRRLLKNSTPQQPPLPRLGGQPGNNPAQAKAKELARALRDSDEAAGVLAAAIMLAAGEMQRASADLASLPTMHTPPATASLPEDIGHWSHVQLDQVQAPTYSLVYAFSTGSL